MGEDTIVAKLKGVESESFVFITLSSDFGAITRMSYPAVTEADLWAALHKMRLHDHEIKALTQHARVNPSETVRIGR